MWSAFFDLLTLMKDARMTASRSFFTVTAK
jgi:hypothetical protein